MKRNTTKVVGKILRLSNPSTSLQLVQSSVEGGQTLYYVGSTYSLKNRIAEHNAGLDFFTKQHLPVELVYFEEYQTKEEAAKREYQIKKWSREKKEKLISGEWKKL